MKCSRQGLPALIQYLSITCMSGLAGFCLCLSLLRRAWPEDMAVNGGKTAWGIFIVIFACYLASTMAGVWMRNHPRPRPHWLDGYVMPLQVGVGAVAFVCVAWWFLG